MKTTKQINPGGKGEGAKREGEGVYRPGVTLRSPGAPPKTSLRRRGSRGRGTLRSLFLGGGPTPPVIREGVGQVGAVP